MATGNVICPSCHAASPSGSPVCRSCGRPLPRFVTPAQPPPNPAAPRSSTLVPCPDCQQPISRSAGTCPRCGYEFVARPGGDLAGFGITLLVLSLIGSSLLTLMPARMGGAEGERLYWALSGMNGVVLGATMWIVGTLRQFRR